MVNTSIHKQKCSAFTCGVHRAIEFLNWQENPLVEEYFCKFGKPVDTKFLQLLDSCNAHTYECEMQYGNISVLYLPSNVMLLVQPMDQVVIENMKCYYQWDFLCQLVNHTGTVKDFQHTYTICDVVFSVACAWNSVQANMCIKSAGNVASHNDCWGCFGWRRLHFMSVNSEEATPKCVCNSAKWI